MSGRTPSSARHRRRREIHVTVTAVSGLPIVDREAMIYSAVAVDAQNNVQWDLGETSTMEEQGTKVVFDAETPVVFQVPAGAKTVSFEVWRRPLRGRSTSSNSNNKRGAFVGGVGLPLEQIRLDPRILSSAIYDEAGHAAGKINVKVRWKPVLLRNNSPRGTTATTPTASPRAAAVAATATTAAPTTPTAAGAASVPSPPRSSTTASRAGRSGDQPPANLTTPAAPAATSSPAPTTPSVAVTPTKPASPSTKTGAGSRTMSNGGQSKGSLSIATVSITPKRGSPARSASTPDTPPSRIPVLRDGQTTPRGSARRHPSLSPSSSSRPGRSPSPSSRGRRQGEEAYSGVLGGDSPSRTATATSSSSPSGGQTRPPVSPFGSSITLPAPAFLAEMDGRSAAAGGMEADGAAATNTSASSHSPATETATDTTTYRADVRPAYSTTTRAPTSSAHTSSFSAGPTAPSPTLAAAAALEATPHSRHSSRAAMNVFATRLSTALTMWRFRSMNSAWMHWRLWITSENIMTERRSIYRALRAMDLPSRTSSSSSARDRIRDMGDSPAVITQEQLLSLVATTLVEYAQVQCQWATERSNLMRNVADLKAQLADAASSAKRRSPTTPPSSSASSLSTSALSSARASKKPTSAHAQGSSSSSRQQPSSGTRAGGDDGGRARAGRATPQSPDSANENDDDSIDTGRQDSARRLRFGHQRNGHGAPYSSPPHLAGIASASPASASFKPRDGNARAEQNEKRVTKRGSSNSSLSSEDLDQVLQAMDSPQIDLDDPARGLPIPPSAAPHTATAAVTATSGDGARQRRSTAARRMGNQANSSTPAMSAASGEGDDDATAPAPAAAQPHRRPGTEELGSSSTDAEEPLSSRSTDVQQQERQLEELGRVDSLFHVDDLPVSDLTELPRETLEQVARVVSLRLCYMPRELLRSLNQTASQAANAPAQGSASKSRRNSDGRTRRGLSQRSGSFHHQHSAHNMSVESMDAQISGDAQPSNIRKVLWAIFHHFLDEHHMGSATGTRFASNMQCAMSMLQFRRCCVACGLASRKGARMLDEGDSDTDTPAADLTPERRSVATSMDKRRAKLPLADVQVIFQDALSGSALRVTVQDKDGAGSGAGGGGSGSSGGGRTSGGGAGDSGGGGGGGTGSGSMSGGSSVGSARRGSERSRALSFSRFCNALCTVAARIARLRDYGTEDPLRSVLFEMVYPVLVSEAAADDSRSAQIARESAQLASNEDACRVHDENYRIVRAVFAFYANKSSNRSNALDFQQAVQFARDFGITPGFASMVQLASAWNAALLARLPMEVVRIGCLADNQHNLRDFSKFLGIIALRHLDAVIEREAPSDQKLRVLFDVMNCSSGRRKLMTGGATVGRLALQKGFQVSAYRK